MPNQNKTIPEGSNVHLTNESIELRFFLFIRSILMILVASTSNIQNTLSPDDSLILKVMLWGYVVYTVIANFTHQGKRILVSKALFTVDLILLTLLFWVDSGSNIDLSHMFVFLIAFMAFTGTFKNAILLTVISSTIVLANATYIGFTSNNNALMREVLIQAIYIGFIGLSLSIWGKNRTKNNNRLNFLYDLLNDINNRLGERHALESICKKIGFFFNAERIIVITHNKLRGGYTYLSLSGENLNSILFQENLENSLLQALISPPQHLAFSYSAKPVGGIESFLNLNRESWKVYSEDPFEPKHENLISKKNQIVSMMDEMSFMSIGMIANDECASRIYIRANIKQPRYNLEDLIFMQKIVNIIRPVFSNIQLIYELLEEAERKERERIYRDLHDRSIQPYIGLKLSLEAIKRSISNENPAQPMLDDTIRMTDICLTELRQFAINFRNLNNISQSDLKEILETIRHRYSKYFNIQTTLNIKIGEHTPTRLIREIPAITMEAMSNILRHSGAKTAEITILDTDNTLQINIAYDERPSLNDLNEKPIFDPISIRQRIEDLGGTFSTYYNKNIYTTLDCRIPY